jgi:hypothetical protein
VLTLLMTVPAISAAVGLTALEQYRALRPGAPLFGDRPAATFVEALVRADQGLEDAYSFVAAGQDPNALIEVNDETLSGGRTVVVTPLIVAVAARSDNLVEMLLAFGARPDLPRNRPAYCLANMLGSERVAEFLTKASPGFTPTGCPQRPPDANAPPLTMIE